MSQPLRLENFRRGRLSRIILNAKSCLARKRLDSRISYELLLDSNDIDLYIYVYIDLRLIGNFINPRNVTTQPAVTTASATSIGL